MNCIQPSGAGGRDVQVAAVVGLDLVDRRQDLPADAVLDAGGLVDRQQEDRHAELADDEVRDAGDAAPGRGARRRRSGWSGGRAVRRCAAWSSPVALLSCGPSTSASGSERRPRRRLGLVVVARRRLAPPLVAASGCPARSLVRCSSGAAGVAGGRVGAAGRGAGASAPRRDRADRRAGRDLDVLERSAGRDVDLHRDELAVGEPHLEGLQLGGAPAGSSGATAATATSAAHEQRVKEPDLHPRSHCPPSGPSSGPLPARKLPDAPTIAGTLSGEIDLRNGEPLRAIRGGSFGVPIRPPEGNKRLATVNLRPASA